MRAQTDIEGDPPTFATTCLLDLTAPHSICGVIASPSAERIETPRNSPRILRRYRQTVLDNE